jgi:uroporphyrinogen-III decarboxylase
MTSKERVFAAMHGQPVDRVPVMCQLSQGHIYRHSDFDPLEYWYTSEGHARGFLAMAARYRFDGILLNRPGFDPDLAARAERVEADSPGHRIYWKDGTSTFVPPDDYPADLVRGRAGRPDSIQRIDVNAVPTVACIDDLPGYYFDMLDYVIPRVGHDLSIHGEVISPFSMFLYQFDSLQSGLMGLMDDPGTCEAILQRTTLTATQQALAQCSRPIDAVKISSAYAGAGFISRDMYRRFVLPYEREVIAAVHQFHALPCYLHTCGAIGDRLDLMVESGTNGLECLDPPPLGTVDLAQAVAQVGDRIFIKGNLDAVNEMAPRTPAEVKAIARRRIEIGRHAKGYILSSACSVSPTVPPENVAVLYEAAMESASDPT